MVGFDVSLFEILFSFNLTIIGVSDLNEYYHETPQPVEKSWYPLVGCYKPFVDSSGKIMISPSKML